MFADKAKLKAIEVLVDEINTRHFKKALLVTDNTLISCGVAGKVMDTLNVQLLT